MGSTKWKGQILSSGLNTSIAGKEVELGTQVLASQLPTIQGSGVLALDNLDNLSSLDSTNIVPPNATTDQNFVAPTTFYAPAPLKDKSSL